MDAHDDDDDVVSSEWDRLARAPGAGGTTAADVRREQLGPAVVEAVQRTDHSSSSTWTAFDASRQSALMEKLRAAQLDFDDDDGNGDASTGTERPLSESRDSKHAAQERLRKKKTDHDTNDEAFLATLGDVLTEDRLRQLTGYDDLDLVIAAELIVDANTNPSFGTILGETMPLLQQLKLNRSDIFSCRALGTKLSRLRVLFMCNASVTDLAGLDACHQLVEVYLAFNDIQDIWPLGGLYNLEVIDLEGNNIEQLEDVDALVQLTELRALTLSGNPVQLTVTNAAAADIAEKKKDVGRIEREVAAAAAYRDAVFSRLTPTCPHFVTLDDVEEDSHTLRAKYPMITAATPLPGGEEASRPTSMSARSGGGGCVTTTADLCEASLTNAAGRPTRTHAALRRALEASTGAGEGHDSTHAGRATPPQADHRTSEMNEATAVPPPTVPLAPDVASSRGTSVHSLLERPSSAVRREGSSTAPRSYVDPMLASTELAVVQLAIKTQRDVGIAELVSEAHRGLHSRQLASSCASSRRPLRSSGGAGDVAADPMAASSAASGNHLPRGGKVSSAPVGGVHHFAPRDGSNSSADDVFPRKSQSSESPVKRHVPPQGAASAPSPAMTASSSSAVGLRGLMTAKRRVAKGDVGTTIEEGSAIAAVEEGRRDVAALPSVTEAQHLEEGGAVPRMGGGYHASDSTHRDEATNDVDDGATPTNGTQGADDGGGPPVNTSANVAVTEEEATSLRAWERRLEAYRTAAATERPPGGAAASSAVRSGGCAVPLKPLTNAEVLGVVLSSKQRSEAVLRQQEEVRVLTSRGAHPRDSSRREAHVESGGGPLHHEGGGGGGANMACDANDYGRDTFQSLAISSFLPSDDAL